MPEVDPTQNQCLRCGTCCRKSSPTLHPEDRPLVEQGILSKRNLYTLRRGEHAFDPMSGGVIELKHELVKVGEQAGGRTCRFLDTGGSGCTIYDSRPVQCRTLECWNPEPLVVLYNSEKLSRLDLIRDSQIRELVLHHEERTSFTKLAEGFRGLQSGKPDSVVLDILNFDLRVREFVVERNIVDPETLAFHFGRPMIECLSGFGYRVEGNRSEGFVLVPTR